MKLILKICLLFLFGSCANMIAPTGGEKDVFPPQLLSVTEVIDKEGEEIKAVYFDFDEFIVLNSWEENFYISPPIETPIQKKVKGQILHLIIEDTLAENTTYNLALSHCIKDLNEGNVLDLLNYTFSTTVTFDSLTLRGNLQDSYTLEKIENAWIMLFQKERKDSVIFKQVPNYIAKTDNNGHFNFPNLKAKDYKMVALTGFDFIYDKGEKIAFLDRDINAETDSFISLFAFDPVVEIDTTENDTLSIINDSIINDSLKKEELLYGNLHIITEKNSSSIFQLIQNTKIITESVFNTQPFSFKNIIPGEYQLKYIHDVNEDGKWNSGNWERKTQPEKVINYPLAIIVRSNWDLELEWDLD